MFLNPVFATRNLENPSKIGFLSNLLKIACQKRAMMFNYLLSIQN